MVVKAFQRKGIFFVCCCTIIYLQEFYINIELRYLSLATIHCTIVIFQVLQDFQSEDFDLLCVNILKHLSHHKNSIQQWNEL